MILLKNTIQPNTDDKDKKKPGVQDHQLKRVMVVASDMDWLF